MKKFHFSNILGALIFVAAVLTVSKIAPAAGESSPSFSLKDLPPIVLEKCIEVQKFIGRNPFSPVDNDYLLVTKYEEKSGKAGDTNKGLIPGRAFNIYLVYNFLLSKKLETGIIRDSALVVKVSVTETGTSREIVREWILIDQNGDRNIDQGVFRETVRGKGQRVINSNEVAFPGDRLPELQAYYENAAVALDNRAAEGRAQGCFII